MNPADVEKAAPFEDVPLEQPTPTKAAQSPQKNRRLRLALAAGALLAVVGLVVGLSVGLTTSNDSSDSADAVENPIDGVTTDESPFPYSKSFVDFICSEESISEVAGLDQCKDACEAFDCCDPFKENNDSCLQDHLKECVNYAKCQAVMLGNAIDAAPATLAETCSLESIAANRADCEEACSEVECCYSTEDNCEAYMFPTCLDYSPCQNLRNTTDILPVAPENLGEMCALNRTNDDQCEAACEPASCCTIENLFNDGGCLQTDFISCVTYAACGGLLIPPLNSEVKQAPDNVTDLCTVDNLLGMGYEECESACSLGKCCTDLDDGENCFLDDPLGCLEYTPCGLLQLTGGNVPRAPEDLKDICNLDLVRQGGEAAAACATACDPAKCCTGLDAESNCLDNGNFFTCAEYLPCAVLYVAGSDLPSPPDNLDEVCSAQAVDADNGQACAAACNDAICCFAADDNCLLGNGNTCVAYMQSGCWRVEGWLSGIPPTEEPVETSMFPFSKSFVDDICSSQSITKAGGLEQCTDACQLVGCCDPFNTDESCLQEELGGCLSYAKCQGVMVRNDIEPAPTTLADTCSPETLAESKTDCENACSAVECCFSSEDNCEASMFPTCLDYAACQNLRNGTDILNVAPDNLDEICALNRTDNDACEKACEPASCCLEGLLEGESCLQSDFISCLTYAACGGLLIPPINSEVPDAPENIAELCTVDNLLDSGYEACEGVCSSGDCCTEFGDESCFLSDPLGCLEYARCGLLNLTGGDIPRAPDDLQDICRWNTIKDNETAKDICVEACTPGECCVGLDAESNCADDGNFFTCAEYFPCTVLYITGGSVERPPDNIDQVCSRDGFNDDDGAACATACEGGSCCFQIDDNCLVGNADVCGNYLASGCFRVDGWLGFDPPF